MRDSYFPGSGAVRYWFERRGYKAEGALDSALTPLRSFESHQKVWLASDVAALAFGTGVLSYRTYEWFLGE